MQQFVVPQFIDVEDKILGPITTRQFLILLVAGIMIFIAYRFGDLALFITAACIIGGLALLFAFGKINGQQFHYFLLNIVQNTRNPKTRAWRKDLDVATLNYLRKLGTEEALVPPAPKVQPRRARIRDLALVVNTGGFYRPDDNF